VPTYPARRQRAALRLFTRLTVGRAVLIILAVATGLTLLLAWLEHLVEPETFTTYPEALWFAITTVTTTGYGDLVPETGPGRLVASAIMLLSLALVPVLTSIVVSALVIRVQQRQAEMLAEEEDPGGATDVTG
jgi:voltage-gated potassium channel